MRKSHWLLVAAAAVLASPVLNAQPTLSSTPVVNGTRMPSVQAPAAQRIPKTNAAGLRKQFDLFGSTDYFNFTMDFANPPSPDIAVGPDDVLVVVGNKIMRAPNLNSFDITPGAVGSDHAPYFAATDAAGGLKQPLAMFTAFKQQYQTSEAFMDTWVGQNILEDACPGAGSDATHCLIQSPVVRYDQMHGRFVVAFVIIDTGVRGQQPFVSVPRRATWVLLVSRFATFADANGNLPVGTNGTTMVFTTPIPPPGVVVPTTGGVNNFWYEYHGGTAGTTATGFLDINRYSTHPAGNPAVASAQYAASYDTTNCTIATPGPGTSAPVAGTICLIPTAVRIGLDNDAITLVSPVVNANAATSPGLNGIPYTTGPFYGNRVRVLSKRAIYTGNPLTNGNTLNPPAFGLPDLSIPALPFVSTWAQKATQWDMFRVLANGGGRYTIGLNGLQGEQTGVYFEPIHLRGRTLAKFSNYPLGGYTQLIGTRGVAAAGPSNTIYTQAITYRPDFVPALDGTVEKSVMVPDQVLQPARVNQQMTCSTTPCNEPLAIDKYSLYVGDARPQRAIYREGHIYDARSGQDPYGAGSQNLISNLATQSTVFYDVVQTIVAAAPGAGVLQGVAPVIAPPLPSLVLYTKWQNGHFYAPMFDVPANVLQGGAVSPVNQIAYWDKLFVGTTSPRFQFPNVTGNGDVWPSLFDMRQGYDRFERFVTFRNPWTGWFSSPTDTVDPRNLELLNPFPIRGGATTDPIYGGLWLYGAFANYRLSGNMGNWATDAAYYDMSFNDVDAYGTDGIFFADVTPATSPFFIYIQTARNLGLTDYLNNAPSRNSPPHGGDGPKPNFLPNQTVTRKEMAGFIINSQMDTATIDAYLASTPGGTNTSSFSDVPLGGGTWQGLPITALQAKAIEVMWRRGYTRGCGLTNDGTLAFCPNDETTRGQMAVFVIRAKLNNVFPTVFSGCPPLGIPGCTNFGDNFGLFVNTTPYFTDAVLTGASTRANAPAPHPFFIYIQKLRELRITTGLGNGEYGADINPPFAADAKLTRGQMATFIVRAFFF